MSDNRLDGPVHVALLEPFEKVRHLVLQAFASRSGKLQPVSGLDHARRVTEPVCLGVSHCGMPAQQAFLCQRACRVCDGSQKILDIRGCPLRALGNFCLYRFDVQRVPVYGEVRHDVFGDDRVFEIRAAAYFQQPCELAFLVACLAQGVKDALGVVPEIRPVRELVNVEHVDNIVYFTQNARRFFFYIFPKSFLCPEKLLRNARSGSLQGENPVKAGDGRAAVREDETGISQCMRTRV